MTLILTAYFNATLGGVLVLFAMLVVGGLKLGFSRLGEVGSGN